MQANDGEPLLELRRKTDRELIFLVRREMDHGREAIRNAVPKPRKKTERRHWRMAAAVDFRERDSGGRSESTSQTTAHSTPHWGADSAGVAGLPDSRPQTVRKYVHDRKVALGINERVCREDRFRA